VRQIEEQLPAQIEVGDRVSHLQYGNGTVLWTMGDFAWVAFGGTPVTVMATSCRKV
jgi:hypothetical protein